MFGYRVGPHRRRILGSLVDAHGFQLDERGPHLGIRVLVPDHVFEPDRRGGNRLYVENLLIPALLQAEGLLAAVGKLGRYGLPIGVVGRRSAEIGPQDQGQGVQLDLPAEIEDEFRVVIFAAAPGLIRVVVVVEPGFGHAVDGVPRHKNQFVFRHPVGVGVRIRLHVSGLFHNRVID